MPICNLIHEAECLTDLLLVLRSGLVWLCEPEPVERPAASLEKRVGEAQPTNGGAPLMAGIIRGRDIRIRDGEGTR